LFGSRSTAVVNCVTAAATSPLLYAAMPLREASAPVNTGAGAKASAARLTLCSGVGEVVACAGTFAAGSDGRGAPIMANAAPASTIVPPIADTCIGQERRSRPSAKAASLPRPPHRPHRGRAAGTAAPHAAQIRASATYRTSRHDRIRTPACPTPLLKSCESPRI
jgi:hypothetical protein